MASMNLSRRRVLIVGGGNAAHVLAARCGQIGITFDWLTTMAGEAERLTGAGAKIKGVSAHENQSHESWVGFPDRISADPAAVVPDADLIILSIPAFAQEPVLNSIGPYVSKGTCIGAIPGSAAIDAVIKQILGPEKAASCTLFGSRTLPWACRIKHYGRQVTVFGTKQKDQIAVYPKDHRFVVDALQAIVGSRCEYIPVDNFLFLSFTMPWHPCFIYGKFRGWDGKTPFSEIPDFYRSVDQFTADLISDTSDEILALRDRIVGLYPTINLSDVKHVRDWMRDAYGAGLKQKNSGDLRYMIAENPAYQKDLYFPMKPAKGGWVPDFSSRYLTEDVPFTLLVHKGLADLSDMELPKITRLIDWCQTAMGKEYLVADQVKGKDIGESRAPQRFGYHEIHPFFQDMGYI